MRTTTDAIRSMKKYIAASLGSEWEVRLAGEEGAFHRPFARVGPSTAARLRSLGGGGLRMEYVLPFSVVCHPVEKATPDEARLEAERVRELLVQAFMVGTHAPAHKIVGGFVEGVQAYNVKRGHPLRIPLYDYDGVALDQAVSENARHPRDFMRVTSEPGIDIVQDTTDDLRLVVTATATMSWGRSAAVLSAAMTVESVSAEGEGA